MVQFEKIAKKRGRKPKAIESKPEIGVVERVLISGFRRLRNSTPQTEPVSLQSIQVYNEHAIDGFTFLEFVDIIQYLDRIYFETGK